MLKGKLSLSFLWGPFIFYTSILYEELLGEYNFNTEDSSKTVLAKVELELKNILIPQKEKLETIV